MMNMSHNATCRVVMLGVDCCSIQGSLRLHLPTDQIKRDSHLCVCVWLQWRQLHPAVCLSANWPQYIMNTAQSDREWERETVSHSNTRSNNCFYFSLFPSSHWHTHPFLTMSCFPSSFFSFFSRQKLSFGFLHLLLCPYLCFPHSHSPPSCITSHSPPHQTYFYAFCFSFMCFY